MDVHLQAFFTPSSAFYVIYQKNSHYTICIKY